MKWESMKGSLGSVAGEQLTLKLAVQKGSFKKIAVLVQILD